MIVPPVHSQALAAECNAVGHVDGVERESCGGLGQSFCSWGAWPKADIGTTSTSFAFVVRVVRSATSSLANRRAILISPDLNLPGSSIYDICGVRLPHRCQQELGSLLSVKHTLSTVALSRGTPSPTPSDFKVSLKLWLLLTSPALLQFLWDAPKRHLK
ncbi:hypothetical protein CC78DRAFT_578615 [Lojkania enalia]|uniref:Uncharacterized protein n=1 Tax=Lojkania enalia TaxID=147567 RepID=A0A9P4N5F0_9PLEO|nr:hypothetical protein CC78DRAFT_578615 [Didymosphaeria enalia]